jgi:GTPase
MTEEFMIGTAGFRCGYITLLGRPNAGKSTLLNRLLDQKISITSRKPQTTRWQLLGIKSGEGFQAIYIDTPGIQSDYDSPVHRHMTREAVNSLEFVNVVIFMIEAMRWSEADARVFELVRTSGLPVILVINKIDKVRNRGELLPFIQKIAALTENRFEVVPISAKTGDNIAELEKTVLSLLPEGPPAYEEDQVTNRNQRFFAAEFIREKLIQRLGDELPYRVAVTIEDFTEDPGLISIKGVIWVESNSQKNIIIGKNGDVMKAVGEAARKDMEELFQKKVFLRNWVKVRKNWTMDAESLTQLGYTSDPV